MTVMYSFCVWFPVRFGAIIVALTCILESLACLIATAVGLQNKEKFSEDIGELLETYDLLLPTDFYLSVKNDPVSYFHGVIIALCIHIAVCLLLLLGSFKCKIWLIYPFVGIDFLRILTLSAMLILILLIIKTNTITLGLVIGCSIFGGFVMLYLWYQWFCVVSLCQIIKEVQTLETAAAEAPTSQRKTLSSQNFNSKIGFANDFEPYYIKAQNAGKHQQDRGYFGLPILN